MRIDYAPQGGEEIILALTARTHKVDILGPRLQAAAELVYQGTRMWFDSAGEGSWPVLADSTIEKKTIQGAAEPDRILYSEGNLYESMTSRSGPYSFFVPWPDAIIFGVRWEKDNRSIPEILAKGGTGWGHSTIPARPLWPPIYSTIGRTIISEINKIVLGQPGSLNGMIL